MPQLTTPPAITGPDDAYSQLRHQMCIRDSFRGNLMDKIERYPGYFTIDNVSV